MREENPDLLRLGEDSFILSNNNLFGDISVRLLTYNPRTREATYNTHFHRFETSINLHIAGINESGLREPKTIEYIIAKAASELYKIDDREAA